MAVVLSHGKPDHQRDMHPFFRPDQENHRTEAPNSTSASPVPSLDGSTDLVNESDLKPGQQVREHLISQNQNNIQSRGSAISTDIGLTVTDTSVTIYDEDLDLNDDRRKRRRISPAELKLQDRSQKPVNGKNGRKIPFLVAQSRTVPGKETTTSALIKSHDVVKSAPNPNSTSVQTQGNLASDPPLSQQSAQRSSETAASAARSTPSGSPTKTASRRSKRVQESPPDCKTLSDQSAQSGPSPRRTPKKPNAQAKSTQGSSRSVGMRNGKLVSSLYVKLSYGVHGTPRSVIGQRIDSILCGKLSSSLQETTEASLDQRSATALLISRKAVHPFFQEKVGRKPGQSGSVTPSEASSVAQDVGNDVPSDSKAPKAWKDIVFSKEKLSRAKPISLIDAPWPPLNKENSRPPAMGIAFSRHLPFERHQPKSKERTLIINDNENIIMSYAFALLQKRLEPSSVNAPRRLVMEGQQLLESVNHKLDFGCNSPTGFGISKGNIQLRVEFGMTAFDRGLAAGPQDWSHEYAPQLWEEVMQPECQTLYDWLREMKVHQVRSAKPPNSKQRKRGTLSRKKRAKRHVDELDDFIVSSDDEQDSGSSIGKNAILLVGPHGCGKTASVFTVANQLEFEVFEIHPGMRRTAKDIFDKVGDMTQNHLVQQTQPSSRRSSEVDEEVDRQSVQREIASGIQPTMATFVKNHKQNHSECSQEERPIAKFKEQQRKQSVILFEEVDILFDEDKSFWSGVQSLISQSKRPIILTCNDLQSVPVEDLNLHAILSYKKQSTNDAARLLTYLAAAEGHFLEPQAVRSLYLSKGQDLRASINELNFWCQMAVGSRRGGLDWMGRLNYNEQVPNQPNQQRIVSANTYYEGLDFIPHSSSDHTELLQFAHENLDFSVGDWEGQNRLSLDEGNNKKHKTKTLDDYVTFYDTRSAMDITDPSVSPLFSSALKSIYPARCKTITRASVAKAFLTRSEGREMILQDFVSAFEPIMEDNRTFPPSTGRTAPSLEPMRQSLATDVAPYVRTIVSFDQRLEEQRKQFETTMPGKKARTTRAAIAALEGGDKASTRHGRWFPQDLDFSQVLNTGNNWPLWRSFEGDYMTETSSNATQSMEVNR